MSRKKMYSKFGEQSFHNTTSTPVKSPLNSVSAIIIESYAQNKILINCNLNF